MRAITGYLTSFATMEGRLALRVQLLLAAGLCVACLVRDPVWSRSRIHRPFPVKISSFSKPIVKSEQVVPRRDLLFRLDRLKRAKQSDPELENALLQNTPEVLWRATQDNGKWRYGPIIPSPIAVKETLAVDAVIFGGEIESIATALAVANTGRHVAVVYDGHLGGLCSDMGANLRYWDGMPDVPRTPAQLELFDAIGVKGNVAIPIGVEQSIAQLISSKYADRVRLIPVESLDNVRIARSTAIDRVVTDSGIQLTATQFVDTDPECRIGEMAGIEYSVETPNLSYGMVFDLENMTPDDWTGLRDPKMVSLEAIQDYARVRMRPELYEGLLKASILKLKDCLETDFLKIFRNSSFGYKSLAEGFNTYMQLKALREPSAELTWLNAHRVTSGFNISRYKHSANLNSISYSFDETLLQNGHSLATDPLWSSRFRVEAQGMSDYFRDITKNSLLTVRIPNQFYVRRSTAFFKTTDPYTAADFAEMPKSKWWMDYPMDLRDIRFRDAYEQEFYDKMVRAKPEVHRWNCRGTTMATKIPNLFLLNKCAVTPEFSGGLRILQNLINTGQDWVDHLPVISSKLDSSRSIAPPSDQRSSTHLRP